MPAGGIPDLGLDEQDQAEAFDETHLDEETAEFVTLEEIPDVYDSTRALGDSRDLQALDADELDPSALDDEDLEDDEDLDDEVRDDLEDEEEDDDIDEEDVDGEDGVDRLEFDEVDLENVADVDAATDPDDEDETAYESEELSDEDLAELGYREKAPKAQRRDGARPEDVAEEVHPYQDELLDEGVEETFPASDPVSVKRIT
jgi:hypothetical protein